MPRNAFSATTIIAALLLPFSATSAAPAIYKCSKDGGVIFSPTPCGANAKQVDTSRALMHGTSPNLQGVSDNAALSRIDGDCQNREFAIETRYRGAYADASAEESRLQHEMAYSTNNFAGATRDNGIRAQLAAIEQRRSDTARSERQERTDLRKSCDDERTAERNRQASRDTVAAKTDAHQ